MQNHKQLVVVLGIIENNGRFLVTRRVDEVPMWHHKWGLPGGKIEHGETPVQALLREAEEETGLRICDPELLGVHTHHWNLSENVLQTFLIIYRATSDTDQVRLDPEENDAHRWVTLEEFFSMDDHLDSNREMIMMLYASRFH